MCLFLAWCTGCGLFCIVFTKLLRHFKQDNRPVRKEKNQDEMAWQLSRFYPLIEVRMLRIYILPNDSTHHSSCAFSRLRCYNHHGEAGIRHR